MIDVLIIGGGIAGLAAAFETTRLGRSTLLLEASPRLGGIVRTEIVDGCVVDAGPDSFLVQKAGAIDLCAELGLTHRLIATAPPRTAYVWKAGRLEPLPEPSFFGLPTTEQALQETQLLSATAKDRFRAEPDVPPLADVAPDESIAEFFARRFGPETVDWIAEPLLAGIHAGDVDRLSIDALFPSLRQAERDRGSVLRAARARAASADTGGAFRSLKGGMGELIDALVAQIGTRARVATPVIGLEAGDRFVATTADGERIAARSVILATPAFVTARLVEAIDPLVATASGKIRYASSAVVVVSYDRSQIDRAMMGSGFVVPRGEPDVTILAATWITSKWAHRAPDDRVLVRVFLGGARDPDRLAASDDLLVDTAHRDLARILSIQGRPQWSRVYRWTQANPQYDVGHLARVAAIDARLAAAPGLHLTGSGFRSVGLPDVIADARAVAASAVAD